MQAETQTEFSNKSLFTTQNSSPKEQGITINWETGWKETELLTSPFSFNHNENSLHYKTRYAYLTELQGDQV
jgi:hypothetical protein